MRYTLAPLLLALICTLLAACATRQDASDSASINASPWGRLSLRTPTRGVPQATSPPSPQAGWEHLKFRGKTPTQYAYAQVGGLPTLRAQAKSSLSLLRQHLAVPPADLGQLRFSWKVSTLVPNADMGVRDMDDSPARVVLVFTGDRSSFSTKNALLSEISHLLTGEPLPYATLMYVWCNECAPESVIHNPRTDRVRYIPLESGPTRLNTWQHYKRDIRADFVRAFGEEPGELSIIGILSDTDNTHGETQSWFGPLELTSK